MAETKNEFVGLVQEILTRFCRQNGREPAEADVLVDFAERLHGLVQRRGLPRPLCGNEQGSPGEMPERECLPLVAEVLGDASGADRDFFAVPLRQLVKTCFHGEFKTCRDSFREASPDGICRRQELARARLRVSGTHCIDCPYWVTLAPEEHARFLRREWQPEGRATLENQQTVFLPEDFRRLRRYLHLTARDPDKGL